MYGIPDSPRPGIMQPKGNTDVHSLIRLYSGGSSHQSEKTPPILRMIHGTWMHASSISLSPRDFDFAYGINSDVGLSSVREEPSPGGSMAPILLANIRRLTPSFFEASNTFAVPLTFVL